jgi:hypothetical protein
MIRVRVECGWLVISGARSGTRVSGLQTGLAAVLPCRARREMDRPVAGLMMGVPGGLGVLIALSPPLLPWLVATASILAGSAMLMMAFVMRGSAGALMV